MRISCCGIHCNTSVRAGLALLAFTAGPAAAEVPDTLRHSIPAPLSGAQSGERLGTSVAVGGGFTVAGAPWDATGAHLAGVVKVFDSATGALLFVLTNPSPEEGDQFGSSVAISGTRLMVSAPLDNTGAPHAGSVYVYDLSGAPPTAPVVTLNNPGPALGDQFGNAVAISGSRVVVGCAGNDSGPRNAGSVYVYDLDSAAPAVPTATVNNPGPAVDDYFGESVGISGSRVVIGVPRSDSGAVDAGRAYVFNLDGGALIGPVITLINPTPALYDAFGGSVAISGSRVVAGAYGDDTGAANVGSVYVYDLESATPAVPITLNNPVQSDWGLFGLAVAISGTRVVAAARNDSTGAPAAGSVYIYELGSGTSSVPVITLNNPGSDPGDYFGASVAISGAQVAVGSPFDSSRGSGAGSAYVYDLNGDKPALPVATLPDPTPVAGDSFGTSVAVSGNLMVVGAPFEDTGATDAGSVYVYALNGDLSPVPFVVLNNPAPGELDLFGFSVAVSGHYIVVGAPSPEDAGSTYVYDLDSDPATVPVAILTNPDALPGDHFGMAVAVSGTRVIVGAHYADGAAGRAYVYDLTGATPAVPTATLRNPTPASNDNFGRTVAISGSRAVVGAYGDDTAGYASGSAYVYDLDDFAPELSVITLNNPTPAWYDYFGHAVAISGTRVVVSAILDDSGAEDAGSVYVYELTSATPAVPEFTIHNPEVSPIFGTALAMSDTRLIVGNHAGEGEAGSGYVYDLDRKRPTVPVATLHNPGPEIEDYFARSVAVDGNTIAIGTPGDDTVANNKGFAYVFGLSSLTDWRLLHFGTGINTGPGANDADPNHNGIPNLLEFALSGDPVGDTTGLRILPQASLSATDHLQLTFTRITDRTGITLTVQASETMAPPWTDLAQSVNGGPFQIIIAGAMVVEAGSGNYRTVTVGDSVSMSDPASRRRYMRMLVTP